MMSNSEKREKTRLEQLAKEQERMEALIDDKIFILHTARAYKTLHVQYIINGIYLFKIDFGNAMQGHRRSRFYGTDENLIDTIDGRKAKYGFGVGTVAKYIAEKLDLKADALIYMMHKIKEMEIDTFFNKKKEGEDENNS